MKTSQIAEIYNILLKKYGSQGWWPVYSLRNSKDRDERGYYFSNMELRNCKSLLPASQFEIAIGAVLTQNTAWLNVEKALANLINHHLIDPEIIMNIDQDELSALVRPSGYHNQKAKKLKIIAQFLSDGKFLEGKNIPGRDELFQLWGIGNETADSILLYAFNIPVFVVDAYTTRLFGRLGILRGREKYEDIAKIFTNNLKIDSGVYQQYHALIVQHVQEYCKKIPNCDGCVLESLCKKIM